MLRGLPGFYYCTQLSKRIHEFSNHSADEFSVLLSPLLQHSRQVHRVESRIWEERFVKGSGDKRPPVGSRGKTVVWHMGDKVIHNLVIFFTK